MTDTFCQSYKPVCLSHSDTVGTQAQVGDNEKAYYRLCPNEAKAVRCKLN